MAFELLKQSANGIPSPPETHETFFIDENGVPSVKSADGVTRPATPVNGELVLSKGVAPAAGTDQGKLYAKDVSGVTEFFYRDDLGNGGNEVQITNNGSLNAAGGGGSTFSAAGGQIQHITGTGPVDPIVLSPAAAPGTWYYGTLYINNIGAATLNLGINAGFGIPGLDLPIGSLTVTSGEFVVVPFPYLVDEFGVAPSIGLDSASPIDAWISFTSYIFPQPGMTITTLDTADPIKVLDSPPVGKVRVPSLPGLHINLDILEVLLQLSGAIVNGDSVNHDYVLYVSPDEGSTLNPLAQWVAVSPLNIVTPSFPVFKLQPGESLWAQMTVATTTIDSACFVAFADVDPG